MSPRWITRLIVGSALIMSTSRGSSARLTGPYGKSPITAYVVWPLFASFSAEALAEGCSAVVAAESLLHEAATSPRTIANSGRADGEGNLMDLMPVERWGD